RGSVGTLLLYSACRVFRSSGSAIFFSQKSWPVTVRNRKSDFESGFFRWLSTTTLLIGGTGIGNELVRQGHLRAVDLLGMRIAIGQGRCRDAQSIHYMVTVFTIPLPAVQSGIA